MSDSIEITSFTLSIEVLILFSSLFSISLRSFISLKPLIDFFNFRSNCSIYPSSCWLICS